MFKLVVLSALLAVAAARPGLYESPLVYAAPATVAVHEPAYAKVGAIVKSVPTSVSHSSSSVVHSSAHLVEDVLAPAIKTTHVHSAPVVHAAPLVHSAPLLHSAPVYKTYAAHAPVYRTYAASPYVHSPYTSYSGVSPLSYTATGLW